MPVKPLAALHSIDLPRRLVGLLSWSGLALALLVVAAPWIIDRMVQYRMQEALHSQAAGFVQALLTHLETEERAFMRQARDVHNVQGFDQLASRWLEEHPEVLQVTAYAGQETWSRTRLQPAIAERPDTARTPQRLLPVQLLALQRAEETQRPARSALYPLWGTAVTDLYLPLSKGPYVAMAVTLDTRLWASGEAGRSLPDSIAMEVIPFTTQRSEVSEHLVNDSSWEEHWTLRFRSKDPTLSALQSLQPFFVLLAIFFCSLVYFSLRNLRERLRAEETLEKKLFELDAQERLNTLGEMSASIAHEINQPLAAITNYAATAQLLIRSGKGVDQIEPVLKRIEEQSQRAARVMRSVRALVNKEPVQESVVDLGRLLTELKPHLELLTQGHNIGVSTQSMRDLRVRADPTLLEQVFLNLARNSVQALMQTSRSGRRLDLRAFARDHDVCVEVRDNGTGIDVEVADRIFDSFFTTRKDGLGVGLNFCRSVLERFGGRIELHENSTEGVCFLITLPAMSAEPT